MVVTILVHEITNESIKNWVHKLDKNILIVDYTPLNFYTFAYNEVIYNIIEMKGGECLRGMRTDILFVPKNLSAQEDIVFKTIFRPMITMRYFPIPWDNIIEYDEEINQ